MNYDDLKAAELRALCEERGIKPSRAKTDMIADLKADDAVREGTATDYDANLAAWEKELLSQDPQTPESAPEEPVWLSDGRLYKRYERHGKLDDREHHSNLTDVVEEAVIRGREPFGPSFRVTDPDPNTWVYAVNVRD